MVFFGCDGPQELVGPNASGHLVPTQQSQNGAVAVAELVFSGQPLDTETVTIGADVYEFDNNATCCTGGNIQVTVGGSAEATLDNLVTKINTSGTVSVRGDKRGTTNLMVASASAAGGTATAADPSIALTEAASNVVWRPGNVNMNTLAGQALTVEKRACSTLSVTTALVGGADALLFKFDFTPNEFSVQVRDSVGVLKQNVSDRWTLANAGILWTSAGATHVANSDVVVACVWE